MSWRGPVLSFNCETVTTGGTGAVTPVYQGRLLPIVVQGATVCDGAVIWGSYL